MYTETCWVDNQYKPNQFQWTHCDCYKSTTQWRQLLINGTCWIFALCWVSRISFPASYVNIMKFHPFHSTGGLLQECIGHLSTHCSGLEDRDGLLISDGFNLAEDYILREIFSSRLVWRPLFISGQRSLGTGSGRQRGRWRLEFPCRDQITDLSIKWRMWEFIFGGTITSGAYGPLVLGPLEGFRS